MVQIYTYQNSLKVNEGKDKYCFRSVVDQTMDNEQLIKEIISYNSTITEADARAVLSVLNDRVKHFVNLGYKVELPFGWMFNKANGTVARLNDGFVAGSSNHRITTVFKFKDDAADEMIKNAAYRQAGSGYVQIPVIKEMCSILNNGKESDVLEFASGSICSPVFLYNLENFLLCQSLNFQDKFSTLESAQIHQDEYCQFIKT